MSETHAPDETTAQLPSPMPAAAGAPAAASSTRAVAGAGAWAAMTASALFAVASQQDWTSPKGRLVGAGACLATLGAALAHAPF